MEGWGARLRQIVLSGILFMWFSLVLAGDDMGGTDSQALTAFRSNDYQTASREFKKLAENGQAEAQRYLGLMYDKGLGVSQNYQEAVSWYKRAAEQKDPAAQYYLGLKYANGHGVSEDQIQAYIWFALSFNNGYEMAANPLRVLNKSLSTRERQQALRVVAQEMEQ